jgi:hypothetical protein
MLVLVVILVGCTTPTVVVPPTPDIPSIRTESAQTVVARLTIAAALNPTATEAPPQDQPEPIVVTATLAPSPTDGIATATEALPTATTRPPVSGGVYPSSTPRTIPDALTFIDDSVDDGTHFNGGTQFDAAWKVKNTGTTTWTTDYHLRYARGAEMGEAQRFYLTKEVKPGETVDLIADMVAPSDNGTHVSYWQFVNGNGDIIATLYVAIVVP